MVSRQPHIQYYLQLSENFEKKNYGRPVFLEELQATRYFSKVSLDINKIPNSLRQVLPAYSEICIFCVLKNGPTEAVDKD